MRESITLHAGDEPSGLDFLGFHIRHYPAGKTRCAKNNQGELLGYQTRITPSKASMTRHINKLRDTLHWHRSAEQELLIARLAPKIIGWCNYFSACRCSE